MAAAARLVLISIVWSSGCGANAFVLTPRLRVLPPAATSARSFNPVSLMLSADRDGQKKTTTSVVDGSGTAALSVVVAGGGAPAGATGAATSKSSVQQATILRSADSGALAPAEKNTGEAVVRRTVKTVARALPGTWWTSGLPKWMHVVRRRMITKEDWLHLHAASGLVRICRSSRRGSFLFAVGLNLYVQGLSKKSVFFFRSSKSNSDSTLLPPPRAP